MTTPSTTTPAAAPTTTTKVFVGNLSFQTRESDLAHAFEVATEGKGKVLSANIITRGQRSLGFGFVEFDTAAAAEASVQALHRKELDGRPINVEVARPRAAGAPASAPAGAAPVAGEQQQRRPPRGPRRGPQQPPMFGGYPVPPYGFNPRGQPMMMVPPQFMAAAPYGMPQQQQPFRRGPPRQPRPQRERAPENRPLSSATLFVGNLPFVVDDANLKDIFADLHVKEAHVVRTLQGRSKGYGFVEFENEDARAKALASLDKIEVEGRVLVLKPAMVPPTVTKKAEAPAAAPAPATPATPAAVPK